MIFQRTDVEISKDIKQNSILYIAVILLFYGVSAGINITSFALFLHQMDLPKVQIGNILAMELAGNLIIAPLFPRLCTKYGVFAVMVVSLVIRNASLLCFPMCTDIKLNMLCLFIFGISGFCLFASLQYWGVSLLNDKSRTTMVAVMNVMFRTGITIGIGFLFFKASMGGVDLFRTSTIFGTIILLPAFLIRGSVPKPNEDVIKPVAPSAIIKYSVVPILCVLVSNYALLALSNFTIIYAIECGLEYKDALLMNIYMASGNFLFTIPIGMLLDKFTNKIGPLIFILIFTCVGVITIPFVIKVHYLAAIAFLTISAGIGSIYVIGASLISAKFKGRNLATASTIMLMMNSVGGFAGVSTTGAAVDYWGNQGMIISVSVLILFFLLYVIYSINNEQ